MTDRSRPFTTMPPQEIKLRIVCERGSSVAQSSNATFFSQKRTFFLLFFLLAGKLRWLLCCVWIVAALISIKIVLNISLKRLIRINHELPERVHN